MKVGYGSARVEVPPGTPLGGYVARDGGAAGELDPLVVTAVTYAAAGRRVALAVADVVCVNQDLVAAARAAVTTVDLLVVAATHTHSGPETGCLPGGGTTDPDVRNRLVASIRQAVAAAVAAEHVASGTLHRGDLVGVGAVRGIADPEPVVPVDLVAVRDTAGGLTGALVVLPVHPTVLPAANRLVSADLPGAVRRALKRELGPACWVVVATGAAGDISTRHTRRGADPAELDRLAAIVARTCAAMLPELGTPAWTAADGVAWRSTTTALPRRDPLLVDGLADTVRAAVRSAADPAQVRIEQARLRGAELLTGLAGGVRDHPRAPIAAEVTAIRLGTLGVAALPGEPFLTAAAQIQAAAPEPTVVLGYAGGYPGYLPPRAAYQADGYEAMVAAAAPGSLEQVVAVASQLLSTMDGTDHEEGRYDPR